MPPSAPAEMRFTTPAVSPREFARAKRLRPDTPAPDKTVNRGMYQEDIGRLRRDEIDLDEWSVFWDREKEPANPFRIHQILWPETLALAFARSVNFDRGDLIMLYVNPLARMT